jgi:Asp-tRNA(Asn)/Glu-tRNA(Gln) amidotransferase A subunit family amidase
VKPERLIVPETEGLAGPDEASKSGFETLLEARQRAGVVLLRRHEHPEVETLEQSIGNAAAVCSAITGRENRWAQRHLVHEHPGGVSERAKANLAKAEAMSPEDYRAALLARETAQLCHTKLAPLADAIVTLSCPGPAPLWPGDVPGQPLLPRPTGDAMFNSLSSMLFAPSVTLPFMSVGGLPVGAQVMGCLGGDARITAMARWLLGAIHPVVVS